MRFLTTADINTQCTQDDLDVLANSVDSTLDDAEEKAISFFSGYLSRYDLDQVFSDYDGSEETDPRNRALIMFLVDYFLYILYASKPDRQIPEIRIERKDEVLKWLADVQKGNTSPDLPTVDTEEETDVNNPFRFGSNTRVSSTW